MTVTRQHSKMTLLPISHSISVHALLSTQMHMGTQGPRHLQGCVTHKLGAADTPPSRPLGVRA